MKEGEMTESRLENGQRRLRMASLSCKQSKCEGIRGG